MEYRFYQSTSFWLMLIARFFGKSDQWIEGPFLITANHYKGETFIIDVECINSIDCVNH